MAAEAAEVQAGASTGAPPAENQGEAQYNALRAMREMRLVSMTYTFPIIGRGFARAVFELGGRTIEKSVAAYRPEGGRYSAEECARMELVEFSYKAAEACRDFIVYEAQRNHPDDWRQHIWLKIAAPMSHLFPASVAA